MHGTSASLDRIYIMILTEAILKWFHKSDCKYAVFWNFLENFCNFKMSSSHKILRVDLFNVVTNLYRYTWYVILEILHFIH